jgi:hypothetical protein
MPVKIYVSGKPLNVIPTQRFSAVELETDNAVIRVDENYYVATLNTTGK